MDVTSDDAPPAQSLPRADARRNRQALIDAATTVFARFGVDAPVREVAAAAGVGMGTVYRHFPTRADLVVAVHRRQVEACAAAAPTLLRAAPTDFAALAAWVGVLVDFLTTRNGLASALRDDRFSGLHTFFLDLVVPACDTLLRAAVASGEVRGDVPAGGLVRGIANLCAGGDDPDYDARVMVRLLLEGIRVRATRPA